MDEDTIAVLTLPARLGEISIVDLFYVIDLQLNDSQRISDAYSSGLRGNELRWLRNELFALITKKTNEAFENKLTRVNPHDYAQGLQCICLCIYSRLFYVVKPTSTQV
ncbi:hypothetical protein GJ496_004665 [Pomphorhynchus laevis]|nr:hypothetical protein GJ496_004665 [Pomphorhynchus laevis]